MRLIITALLLFCSSLVFAQADTFLVNTVWEETSSGDRTGYILQLNQYGTFEEDAGKNHHRSAQYLMGRWRTDSAARTITLAVDYFLGKNMVASRYRKGQDFYLTYRIVSLSQDSMELQDLLTGDLRFFLRTKLDEAYEDGATRRIPKPAQKGRFKLPKVGGGGMPERF